MGWLQRAAEKVEDALDWDDDPVTKAVDAPQDSDSGEEPPPPWDPEQCSCHINPPCAYCEGGEYTL